MKTANERLLNELIGHEVDLSRLSNGQVRAIIKILNSKDAELRAALIEAIDNLGADLSAPAVDRALADVLRLNQATLVEIRQALDQATDSLISYELAFQQGALRAVLPAVVQDAFPVAAPVFSQVRAIAQARQFQGRLLREWVAGIEANRAAAVRDAVRAGVVEGRTTADIVRTVMGTRAQNYADGILQKPRREVEAVVRSAISHTAETASDAAYEANRDIISHVEWLSTLDTRTSSDCRIRDRLPYTLGTYKPIGHKIPWLAGPGRIHFCCRSTKLPILKSAAKLGFSDSATRASMDGQVPQSTTYADWLRRQPAARQDEILGPTRGQLMREGGLKLEAFYNDKGKLLTLEELHERVLITSENA
ncbi:hypothetical protein [Pseudomonas rubra]|uniref:Phage Mu protein F like protein n=1 Tax=Pseudomonas rubra TaxID=2942627 RepID=A0ABT5PF08_9PSED|nr:hypothetical protein [Pseudomonas rubra]MDD1016903.1 hypothetical protein [Pseudomonas rubra]MDD1039351.1 hypothetical protein [Pseudomonas rubra]MDD1157867.1 hypothetical protein [Pseudomonas rubra]